MKRFLKQVPRFLFFTGKGGVGKTSMSCVTAVGLADQGKRVLLISTDPAFTRVLITALPEPTPTAEARSLHRELQRAHIEPYAWIINRSFALSGSHDPLLCAKGLHEIPYIQKIADELAPQAVLSPWTPQTFTRPEDYAALLRTEIKSC